MKEEEFAIPLRLELLLGYAKRDYEELQYVKTRATAPPSVVASYRQRLKETNRRLWLMADELQLPHYIYMPT